MPKGNGWRTAVPGTQQDEEGETREPGTGAGAAHRELVALSVIENQLRQLMQNHNGPRGRYNFLRPFMHGLQKERTLLDMSLRGDAGARNLRQTGELTTFESLGASPFVSALMTPVHGMQAVAAPAEKSTRRNKRGA